MTCQPNEQDALSIAHEQDALSIAHYSLNPHIPRPRTTTVTMSTMVRGAQLGRAAAAFSGGVRANVVGVRLGRRRQHWA
jgi:hypothetical protein